MNKLRRDLAAKVNSPLFLNEIYAHVISFDQAVGEISRLELKVSDEGGDSAPRNLHQSFSSSECNSIRAILKDVEKQSNK